MFRRLASLVAFALILAGALASTSLAGGRVDIAATSVPTRIVAGQPADLMFSMRYPGGEPVNHAAPVVYARNGKTTITVAAVAVKRDGYYVAHLNLPNQGQWSFEIDSKICGNVCKLSPVMALAAATPAKNTKAN
jgi:hypothetical protein